MSKLLIYEQICARPGRAGRRTLPSVEIFLRRALREFRAERPAEAGLLERRFLERETAKEIALSQSISQETVNRNQHRAILLFAVWLQAQEEEAWADLRAGLGASLPPASYGKLFGAAAVQARLAKLLRARDVPWVICLTGIGGIGKTSLANQTVRALIPNFPFKQIIWLQATENSKLSQAALLAALSQQVLPATTPARERLPALRRALETRPALVVLDNLDAEVDDPAWVDWLQELANPSKFLLCSRRKPAILARAYSLPLGELPAKPSLELMRHQAREIGLESALPAIQKHAAAVYARTGGNPLALKLTVGLLHAWSFKMVLDALQERSGADVEKLYSAIFRASWDSLSRDARRMLLAMPLVGSEGASPAQLKAISGLAGAALRSAIPELHARSLREVEGSAEAPRYAIHQLTLTFLRKEILNEA